VGKERGGSCCLESRAGRFRLEGKVARGVEEGFGWRRGRGVGWARWGW